MTLLVTLLLVLINIFNSISVASPTAETITAMSVWLIACIIFVFGALCNYAGILLMKFKKKDPDENSSNGNIAELEERKYGIEKYCFIKGLDSQSWTLLNLVVKSFCSF